MIRNNHNSNAVTNLFLINFTGDIKASQSVNFAEEVTSILQIAEKTLKHSLNLKAMAEKFTVMVWLQRIYCELKRLDLNLRFQLIKLLPVEDI